MRHNRPDPLLIIVLFVGVGLIVTLLSMEFRPPALARSAIAKPPSQLVADNPR